MKEIKPRAWGCWELFNNDTNKLLDMKIKINDDQRVLQPIERCIAIGYHERNS